ncbi:MAG TPA: hypothetical protein VGH60_05565 [Solirubrobacteraceae bacterium]|jgi:hypothetical protein
MLFDLRGRGRRRTVRVIYGGLALLIGAGLVFFGVGAGVGGGGLLNSLTGNEGAGSASFSAQIDKYKKLTAKQPSNVYAWEQLTLNQLHEAGGEAYFANQRLTAKGRQLFGQTAQSWNRYIALKPPKPNTQLALQMERVFGEEGLNEPAEAVKVLQIVIPTKTESTPQYQASLYAALAEYAYKAGNTRIGDLASPKAIALAPSAQRAQLKKQLAAIKSHPSGGNEYTTTGPKGEPVKLKPNGKGEFKGTTTTPLPAHGSTTTTTK